MSVNNAEIVNQPAPVAPATALPATLAKVEAAVPEKVATPLPVVSPTEKENKELGYAIRMHNKVKGLERKLAEATAKSLSPTPAPIVGEQAQPQTPQSAPVPAQEVKTEIDIEEESVKALKTLSQDPELAQYPGVITDIMDMVDTDKRLKHLHSFDPHLAYEQAAKKFLANVGSNTTPPPIPLPNAPSGGMGGGSKQDLNALYNELDRHRAGTREWYLVANKINAQIK